MSSGGGYSKGGGSKRGRRGEPRSRGDGGSSKQPAADVDESSPVIQAFRTYQQGLDVRHDKYERLVKLSRDVTIGSKRTIFLLHRVTGSATSEEILAEAETKLSEIDDTLWRVVAKELKNEDPYQFLRAYSPGLQEYIEAISFLHYIKYSDLVSLTDVQARLEFIPRADADGDVNAETSPDKDDPVKDVSMSDAVNESTGDVTQEMDALTTETVSEKDNKSTESVSEKEERICVHVPPVEYVLGIADLTGELMRQAITSVGSGNLDIPSENCSFMRVLHDAFVSMGNTNREIPRKLHVLKQSLQKVENACYALQVRGSEIPKHMLADVFNSPSMDTGPGNADMEDM